MRHIRKRKEDTSSEEEDNVNPSTSTASTTTVKPEYKDEGSDSDIDKLEESVQKDIAERDELSKRIKEREKKNTRHIASKSEARAAMEAAKRLKIDEKDTSMIQKLRYESRKGYLAKRKEDKTYELEALVQDDELLFSKEEK